METAEKTSALTEQGTMPVADLIESSLNPRKKFDPEKLSELSASIASMGVLVPLIVRPKTGMVGIGIPRFEVIAGARRLRGAKAAGLSEVPVLVRQYTDLQALEAMLTENLIRDDLHPLEEADGFQKLRDLGVPLEELPDRLGDGDKKRSRSNIYATLELLRLGEKPRDAFLDNKFNRSIALVLAGIGDEKLQLQATKDFLEGEARGQTVRDFREWVRARYMLDLAKAPFDTKDAELTSAGACLGCPHRTGTKPDLFEGLGKDLCTRPSCYQDKVAVDWRAKVEARKAQGLRVLEDAEMPKVFDGASGHLKPDADFRRADDVCDDDPRRRTFKQLLGKAARAKVILAKSPKGEEVELLDKAPLREELKELGHDFWSKEAAATSRAAGKSSASRKSGADDDVPDAEVARRARERAQREAQIRSLVVARIVAQVEKQEPNKEFWRTLVQALLDAGASEYALQRRFGKDEDPKALEKWLGKAGEPQLRALLFELVLEEALYASGPVGLRALCKVYKIDESAVRAEVRDAAKAAEDVMPRTEFRLRAQGENFKLRIESDESMTAKCADCGEESKVPLSPKGDVPRAELVKLEKHAAEHQKKAKKAAGAK